MAFFLWVVAPRGWIPKKSGVSPARGCDALVVIDRVNLGWYRMAFLAFAFLRDLCVLRGETAVNAF